MSRIAPPLASNTSAFERHSLFFESGLPRNRWNRVFTGVAAVFAGLAVLPLVLVLLYVLIQGG